MKKDRYSRSNLKYPENYMTEKQLKMLNKIEVSQKKDLYVPLEENLKHAIMTVHHNGSIEVFIPNEPYDISKVKKFPNSSNHEESEEERRWKDYENAQRSLRYTKKAIRNHIRNNKHTHFLTLTFDSEKYPDNESRIKRVDTWIKQMRRKYKDFNYVLVFELHKSGLIHVHGCMDLTKFPLREAVNPHNNNKMFDSKGRELFNLPDWDSTGFSSITELGDSSKVSNYITKYVTKDLEEIVPDNKKRYRASLSRKPIQRYLTESEVKNFLLKNDVTFQNDFGEFIEIIEEKEDVDAVPVDDYKEI